MNLATAHNYAEKLNGWLMPYADTIFVAGSVRRRRSLCNDVDLVIIPKRDEARDLFGTVTSSQNVVLRHLQAYIAAGKGVSKFLSGGENHDGKIVSVQLLKCQLDVFFAEPENVGSRLLCRTGSKEHNVFIIEHAKKRGDCWKPYEGVFTGGEWRRGLGVAVDTYVGGQCIAGATEAEIFKALDLPFIEPERRER